MAVTAKANLELTQVAVVADAGYYSATGNPDNASPDRRTRSARFRPNNPRSEKTFRRALQPTRTPGVFTQARAGLGHVVITQLISVCLGKIRTQQ